MKEASVEDVKNFYYNWWTMKGTIPNATEVAIAFDANPAVINNMLADKKFRDTLVRRGLPLSSDFVLTPDQTKCIAILTDPTVKGAMTTRLKAAGIPYNTYKAWMQIPDFRRQMTAMAEQILENSLAGVNMGLVQAAERGEVAAVKFFYEVTGRYDPTDKKVMDVMALLHGVVEIISEEITDTGLLERIAGRLSLLASGAGIGTGVRAPVAAYKPPVSPIVQGESFEITPLGRLQ